MAYYKLRLVAWFESIVEVCMTVICEIYYNAEAFKHEIVVPTEAVTLEMLNCVCYLQHYKGYT